jgi:hypothetical protein
MESPLRAWFRPFGSGTSDSSVRSGMQSDLSEVRRSLFVVASLDPFLSLWREEGAGDGESAPGLVRFGSFGLFGSFGNALQSLRRSSFVIRSSLSGPLPFVAPCDERKGQGMESLRRAWFG